MRLVVLLGGARRLAAFTGLILAACMLQWTPAAEGAWAWQDGEALSVFTPQSAGNADMAMTADGSLVALFNDPAPLGSGRLLGVVRAPDDSAKTQVLGAGYSPQVAADGVGGAVAVWVSSSQSTLEASFRPPGGAFGEAVPIPGDEIGSPVDPRLAVDHDGDIAVSYVRQAFDGSRIYVVKRPAGGTWTEPVQASPVYAEQPDYDRVTGITPDGRIIVAWARQVFEGPHRVKVVVGTTEDGFSKPQRLSDPVRVAGEPRLAVDGAGRAIAMWREDTAADAVNGRLRFARLASGRYFDRPHTVPGAKANSAMGQIGASASGEFTFAFTAAPNAITGGVPVVLTGPYEGTNMRGEFPAGNRYADQLELAVTWNGRAILAWQDFRSPVTGDSANESAQRSPGQRFDAPQSLVKPCAPYGAILRAVGIDPTGRGGAFYYRRPLPDTGYRPEVAIQQPQDDWPALEC